MGGSGMGRLFRLADEGQKDFETGKRAYKGHAEEGDLACRVSSGRKNSGV